MPLRRCPATRCPNLIEAGDRYCPDHSRDYEARRGTRQARGYGTPHSRLRQQWQARMDAGERVACARCGLPVDPRQPWALDHADDRKSYLGPSHKRCNDSAGGQRAHASG